MIVDLDTAKKVATDFERYKGSNALELYHACQNDRISLTEHLESLDPTEYANDGSPLNAGDAFTRHLMALDLQLSGPNQVTVENLMAQANYLMPEMVRREILAGMEMPDKFSYKDCVATTVPSKVSTYHPIYIPDMDNATALARRNKSLGRTGSPGKGAEMPRVSIRKREKDIVIQDHGRVVETAYAVIRDYGWSDFAVYLRLIGGQMAADKLFEIYNLALVGDGTVGASTDTFNGVAGTLTYLDVLHNHASYYAPFVMNKILAPLTSFENILSMAQFSDPEAFGGKVFQVSGKPVTPFGAMIKQVNAVPGAALTQTEIATLDSRYAVKEVTSQPLSVEADKIISRKFEEAAISEEYEFCIIADGALKRIIWT